MVDRDRLAFKRGDGLGAMNVLDRSGDDHVPVFSSIDGGLTRRVEKLSSAGDRNGLANQEAFRGFTDSLRETGGRVVTLGNVSGLASGFVGDGGGLLWGMPRANQLRNILANHLLRGAFFQWHR